MTESLDRYYRQAEYRVELTDATLTIRVDIGNPGIDAHLANEYGVRQWAIITPCNPASVPLCETENEIRLAELRNALNARGDRWLRSVNHDPQGHWPDEPGMMILDIPRGDAEALGRQFGQNAIVFGRAGSPPELIWLRLPPASAESSRSRP